MRNSRHQRAHPQLATEWATQGSDRFQPAGRPKDWIPRRTDRTWLPRSARCRWAGPPRGSLQTTVRPQPRPLYAADHPTGATHGRSPHERHTRPTAPLLPVSTPTRRIMLVVVGSWNLVAERKLMETYFPLISSGGHAEGMPLPTNVRHSCLPTSATAASGGAGRCRVRSTSDCRGQSLSTTSSMSRGQGSKAILIRASRTRSTLH